MSSSTEESSTLVKQTNESSLSEYERHTYEELSQEFEEIYPAVARAFELIPQMYNRLTLVDGFTHLEAVNKIYTDHHHLFGFTQRNIRRYLPADNPNIPRKIRTPRPKNSPTESAKGLEVSSTVQRDLELQVVEVNNNNNGKMDENEKRENENKSDPHHTEELNDDKLALQTCNPSSAKYDVVDFEFRLGWKDVLVHMEELYTLGNTREIWFNGELDRRTGNVIAAYTGRKAS